MITNLDSIGRGRIGNAVLFDAMNEDHNQRAKDSHRPRHDVGKRVGRCLVVKEAYAQKLTLIDGTETLR